MMPDTERQILKNAGHNKARRPRFDNRLLFKSKTQIPTFPESAQSSRCPQRTHKKKLQGSRHDKRRPLNLRNPLRRITSRAIVPMVGALSVAGLMKTSTEYWKTCCAAESNVRLWGQKSKYERTVKRLGTSIDTISEETHHKDTKALRMQRQNEVHAKAPRRKGRSESQDILPYFAPLVRQAKLDVSYQLKGPDHGNYSFAM